MTGIPSEKSYVISTSSALVMLLYFSLPLSLQASETVVLKVYLNMEDKGEHFIILTKDGDALLQREDLVKFGLKDVHGVSETLIGQKTYLSLKSLCPRVVFEIDEMESALRITADPNLLEKNIFDLSYKSPTDVIYTKDNAAFLNYSLDYSAGDDLDFKALNIPWEMGVSVGGWLGFSSFSYTKTDEDEKHIRLFSNVTADDRFALRRVVVGDYSAFSGTMGGGGTFGGLSVSKNFAIRPYFTRFPGLDLSGVLETPSDVELYINDVLVKKEHFPAGEFQFLHPPGATGSGDTALVITDAYGRESRVEMPFYISTQLLEPGLHDYSYNIGLKREELGQKSFEYGDIAFVGFHRFGFSRSFTGGMRAEADRHVINVGPSATFVPWTLGETNVSFAVSHEEGHYGYGGFLSHSYVGKHINGGFSTRVFSRDYTNLNISSSENRLRFLRTFRLGYNHRSVGSLSVTYSASDFYTDTDTRRASIFFSRRLWKNVSINIRASRTETDVTDDEVFAGFSFFLGKGKSGSLTYQNRDGRSTETASFQQNPPLGTGLGYRFLIDHNEDEQGEENIEGNASVQYRGPYGIYSTSYNRIAGQDLFDMRVSGGIAYINESTYFTRPITDSFSLVKVGDLDGVKVYYSGHEVGTTNGNGEVVVPNLVSYYPNALSIEPNDIPVNYEISEIREYVSPPLRGGSIVKFGITKIQGFGGRLFVVEKGEKKAAQYWGLNIWYEEKPKEFTVGQDGEFYLENLPVGRFPAKLFLQDKECDFYLTIPESDEMIVDLGEVTCEMD